MRAFLSRAARLALTVAALLVAHGAARAQDYDFNVDIGTGFGGFATPASTYGGASGQTGFWNNVDGGTPFTPIALTDVAGNATGVTLTYDSGVNFNFDNLNTFGDDQALLDDTQCSVGGSTWTFANLQPGRYEVFSYAWAPDVPTSFITHVDVPGSVDPAQDVGGADWTGTHIQGITYAKHTVDVGANGQLQIVFTVTVSFATINGVQIRELYPKGFSAPYCTSGTSSNGCVPQIVGIGTPSASAPYGFTIAAANVEGDKSGLVFYSNNGQQAVQWGPGSASFLCIRQPTQRMLAMNSGGNAGFCDGLLWAEWQVFMAANPGAQGNPLSIGQQFDAQAWYRDPLAVKTTNLTNALHFVLGQ